MSKRLSVSLLIALIIAIVYTISISFSYWAAIEKHANVYISIDGIHDAGLSVDLLADDSNNDKLLVPTGFAFTEDEVDEIIFTFVINITEEELLPGVELALTVTAVNILLDESTQFSHLVVIEITNGGNLLIGNDPVTVTVKVRLTEPATQEIASAIQGKNITFDLHFMVVS